MNEVNNTLYIPLYGKALVSRRGILLSDPKAEEIWGEEGFSLSGKSRSKWLAYYMAMRAAVFDRWLIHKMQQYPEAVILHLGCGMDSRILRVGNHGREWYDVDFGDVIAQRERHYSKIPGYTMLSADVRQDDWLDALPRHKQVIVVMEGISMYLSPSELTNLLSALKEHFSAVHLLMDCYTSLAAKASKYKNPINDVGVTQVYGLDEPRNLESTGLKFLTEHTMTPCDMINQLSGVEKAVFRRLYAGRFSKRLYKLYEYQSNWEETR